MNATGIFGMVLRFSGPLYDVRFGAINGIIGKTGMGLVGETASDVYGGKRRCGSTAKQKIPKTHKVVEDCGLYYCRCHDPECEDCDYGSFPLMEAQEQADILNLREAISKDVMEEIQRMAKDYNVPPSDIMDYFYDLDWLRDALKEKSAWSSYD